MKRFVQISILLVSLFALKAESSKRFERYSVENGLSQNTISAMAQDEYGFMWYGSLVGLNRFDGYNFTVFRHNSKNQYSLSNDHILALFKDAKGTLWIGTHDGGLNRYHYKTETFTHYIHDINNSESLSNNRVTSIVQISSGKLLIGTFGGGLNSFNLQTEKFTQLRDSENKNLCHALVNKIIKDNKNNVWIGTQGGGLCKYNIKTGEFYRYKHSKQQPGSLSSNTIRSLLIDSNNEIWIGTDNGGLERYNASENNFSHYTSDYVKEFTVSNNTVNSLMEDDKGRIWIATDEGLNVLSKNRENFEYYYRDNLDNNSISGNVIRSLYQSEDNIIWIGSYAAGLIKYNPETERLGHFKRNERKPDSISSNKIWAIYEDSSGFIWMGTDGGGLNRFDKNQEHFSVYKHDTNNNNSLSSNRIWSIVEDQPDIFWVGTNNGGLNRMDLNTGKIKRYLHDENSPTSLANNFVINLIKDSKNNIWVGTYNGLDKYDRKTDSFIHYTNDKSNENSISYNTILTIYEDSHNYLWIGTYGGGLNRFDPESGLFKHFKHNPADNLSIGSDSITTIYEDNKKNLWIGALSSGLNLLERETGKFYRFDEEYGIASSAIYGILESESGDLWMSTNSGISKFNLNSLSFTNYNMNDGTQSNEFNTGAYYKTDDGIMLFGGVNGFNQFKPESLVQNISEYSTVITKMRLFNKEVPIELGSDKKNNETFTLDQSISLEKEITLTHAENLFSFEFTSLNFENSQGIRYAYKLKNWNDSWFYTDYRSRRATFTDIPAGQYTLMIKAGKSDIWSNNVTQLEITIVPPPWKSWWAYSLYFASFSLALFWFSRTQKQKIIYQQKRAENEMEVSAKLLKMDKLKDNFLANTSHELRTPLNGMIGLTEALADGVWGDLSEDVISDLKTVAQSGRRLTHLVNDILDFSKMKDHKVELQQAPVNLHILINNVIAVSRSLIKDKHLNLINHVDVDFKSVYADENRLQQILHNLIGNAIKFTIDGSVIISAEAECDDTARISVSDTGRGIKHSDFKHIFNSFEQGDGSIGREFGGTGLGLALTRELVELHHGTISVESEEGTGSTFYFTLPFCEIAEVKIVKEKKSIINKVMYSQLYEPEKQIKISPQKEQSSQIKLDSEQNEKLDSLANIIGKDESDYESPESISSYIDKQPRILIVDDDQVNRRVIRNQLFDKNYNLQEASSGQQAIDLLEYPDEFDLILLDVMMPNKSGYDVCKMIRKQCSIHELPVIFITAKTQKSDLVESFKMGANDFITKPIEKSELIARVTMHLELLKINRSLTAKIQQKNQNIITIAEIGRLITAGFDMEKTLHTVYQSIKSLMPVENFGIGIYSKEDDSINYQYSISREIRYKPYSRSMKDKSQFPVWCIENKSPIFINDVSTEAKFYISDYVHIEGEDDNDYPLVDGTIDKKPNSFIYVPIIANNQILGVLTVQNTEKNKFNKEHLDILQSIVSYTAIALKNANMVNKLLLVEKDKAEEIREQKLKAEIANQSKGQFLATMSHEIRTPMNGVIGMIELLRDTSLNDKQRYYIDIIRRSGESLVEIINDILDYSKIEAGKIELESTRFLLKDVIHDCIQLFSNMANKKKLELIGCISPLVPEMLIGDPTRLRQIIFNLLGNAFKFTDNGFIGLSVMLKEQLKSRHVILKFEIIDSGIGVKKELQYKLFKSFTQAESKTTRKYGGTGLGLAISKRLAKLMGGDIGVISEGQKGSRFWFTAKISYDNNENVLNNSGSNIKQPLYNKNVLSIGEHTEISTLIQSEFNKWSINTKHYDIYQNFEANDIISEFSNHLKTTDYVIINNPFESDLAINISQLIRNLHYETLPIIIYHGEQEPVLREKQIELNISNLIPKPILPDMLANSMIEKLSNKQVHSDSPKLVQDEFEITLPKLQVLVAEDNPTNQVVIKGLLKKLHLSTTVVNNGKEALDEITNNKNLYNLIFMDCEMPIMDGYTATRKIRSFIKDSNLKTPLIIALSAHALKEHQQAAFEAGMDYYLCKPVMMKDITRAFSALGLIENTTNTT